MRQRTMWGPGGGGSPRGEQRAGSWTHLRRPGSLWSRLRPFPLRASAACGEVAFPCSVLGWAGACLGFHVGPGGGGVWSRAGSPDLCSCPGRHHTYDSRSQRQSLLPRLRAPEAAARKCRVRGVGSCSPRLTDERHSERPWCLAGTPVWALRAVCRLWGGGAGAQTFSEASVRPSTAGVRGLVLPWQRSCSLVTLG